MFPEGHEQDNNLIPGGPLDSSYKDRRRPAFTCRQSALFFILSMLALLFLMLHEM